MAIFSRRDLQRMINENSLSALTAKQTQRHVNSLNRHDEDSLATEWEIAIINALAHLGRVQHEVPLGGKSRLDVYCEPHEQKPFALDVRAVSDKGHESGHLADYFQDSFKKYLKSRGVSPAGFSLIVGARERGPEAEKVLLRLPKKNTVDRFIRAHLVNLVSDVASNPRSRHTARVRTEDADLEVNYEPSRFSGRTHPKFTVLLSLENNPAYRALEKKGRKLKDSGFAGTMGIILCDAGAEELNERGRRGIEFGIADVVNRFLSKRTSVSFVLVVTVAELAQGSTASPRGRLDVKRFVNANAQWPIAVNLLDSIEKVLMKLPVPVDRPINALEWLKTHRAEGRSHYGGWQVAKSDVRLSSRAVLELLAGKITQDDFIQHHSSMLKNALQSKLSAGHTIVAAAIERSQHEDDDWIVLKFEPDPAISTFHMPQNPT